MSKLSDNIKALYDLRDDLSFRSDFINKHRDSFVDILYNSYQTVSEKVKAGENINADEKNEKIVLEFIAANLSMASAFVMLGAKGLKLKGAIAKEGEGGEDRIVTKIMLCTISEAADALPDGDNKKSTLKGAAEAMAEVLFLPDTGG